MATDLKVSPAAVRNFWNAHPVASEAVDAPLGSPEYFAKYDKLREVNEPISFATGFHQYGAFAKKRVLEVGCGNAYTLLKYAGNGADVFGVDISESAIELSRKRFQLSELTGDFQVAAAESLPFDDDTFDLICSMGVLHHAPDTAKAVGEILRCLKPGGQFFGMVYNKNSILYRLRFQALNLVRGISLQQSVNEVDGQGNPKGDVYTKSELAHLLHAFEVDEMFAGLFQPWMSPFPAVSERLPEGAQSWLARRAGWFLYFKARAPK
jgi:SAM-dependent methyltransferase